MLSKPLSGVLFFPVTPFSPEGTVDLDAYRRHIERGLSHQPGGPSSPAHIERLQEIYQAGLSLVAAREDGAGRNELGRSEEEAA